MIGTGGIGTFVAVVVSVLVGAPGIAGNSGPAPWDKDCALAMFDSSTPADTVGLAPVWSLAVRDSGRRVENIRNRFSEPGFAKFPIDSVDLRRFETRAEAVYEDHVSWRMDAAVATVHVGGNGEPDSSTPHWVAHGRSEEEPRNVGAHPPIPLDGSRYCLSGNGRFLLVLRAMPHGVNARGETGAFGLLDYFDVSNPKRPRRVGATLEADGALDNGVVSDDGSRVAVTIIPYFPSNHTKVVAFERVGRRLSAPRVVAPATAARGLQFEGRFLFVGIQCPPLPVDVETSTTDTVALYDLGRWFEDHSGIAR